MRQMRLLIFKIITASIVLLLLNACSTTIIDKKTAGLGNPQHVYHAIYPASIWSNLSKDSRLPDETTENPRVLEQINAYVNNPKVLFRIMDQSRPYLYYIYQQVKARNLPAEIALLPMLESSYNPFIYSHVGAAGIWQIMPSTASGYGLKIDWWYDGRRDIIASTGAALDYLTYLNNLFNGDWLLTFAAYDAGEGTIAAAIRRNQAAGLSTDFWNLNLPNEAQNYVPKLLALATIIKHANDYPINLPEIPNEPYLAAIAVSSQINLDKAADMANIDPALLRHLNPGFSRSTTDPNLPTLLLLPIDNAANFQTQLDQMPDTQKITWIQHTVEDNDTLFKIAKRYKTTPEVLRQTNHLMHDQLRLGQVILIPSNNKDLASSALQGASAAASSTEIPSLPELKVINYTVLQNDTVNSVAKKFHVTPNQLRFWNGLKRDMNLTAGQSITIWPPKEHKLPVRRLHTTHTKHANHTSLQKKSTQTPIHHKKSKNIRRHQ